MRARVLSLGFFAAVACGGGGAGRPPPAEEDGPREEADAAPAAGGRGGTAGGGGRAGTPDAAGGAAGERRDAAEDRSEGRDAGLTTAADAAGGDARDAAPAGRDAAGGAATTGTLFLYVGSGFYSGGQSALHVLRLDPGGTPRQVARLEATSYPSFIAVAPGERVLYLNIEQPQSGAAAYGLDPASGMIAKLNEIKNGANGSAYITTDATGRFVLQANYNSHSVSVIAVEAGGRLGAVVETRPQGAGAYPHAIRVDPSNRFVFVPNRTADTISQYLLGPDGKLRPNDPPAVTTPAGTGPRHIDFHPGGRFAYVNGERSGTLTSFALDPEKGTLTQRQRASTVPAGASATPADMRVHPSGRFAYVANRRHGSVAIFALEDGGARLSAAGHAATGGSTPRNLAIDAAGKFLAAGVQDTNQVVIFRIDEETGRLARVAAIGVPVPSGLAFVYLPAR